MVKKTDLVKKNKSNFLTRIVAFMLLSNSYNYSQSSFLLTPAFPLSTLFSKSTTYSSLKVVYFYQNIIENKFYTKLPVVTKCSLLDTSTYSSMYCQSGYLTEKLKSLGSMHENSPEILLKGRYCR